MLRSLRPPLRTPRPPPQPFRPLNRAFRWSPHALRYPLRILLDFLLVPSRHLLEPPNLLTDPSTGLLKPHRPSYPFPSSTHLSFLPSTLTPLPPSLFLPKPISSLPLLFFPPFFYAFCPPFAHSHLLICLLSSFSFSPSYFTHLHSPFFLTP